MKEAIEPEIRNNWLKVICDSKSNKDILIVLYIQQTVNVNIYVY